MGRTLWPRSIASESRVRAHMTAFITASMQQVTLSATSFRGLSSRLAAAPRSTCSGRVSLSMQGYRPQAADYRGMTDEQLNKEITDAQLNLYELRMLRSSQQEFKPHEFKLNKRKIALCKTIKREREIAEGITQKQSRRMNWRYKESKGGT